nr:hypothetical protein [uncultured Actinoplanes sp.]
MRRRRAHRIGLTQADQWAAGDPPGPDHQGLAELLAAAKAPATAEELAGEEQAVAAYTAAQRRAAPPARRKNRARVSRLPSRTVVVNIATVLALLAAGGTAVAARTGNLPADAQQHAHRLFSALGVPAPRTGPTTGPGQAPSVSPQPSTPRTTSRPSPTPAPAGSAAPSAGTAPAGWCRAWSATPHTTKAAWYRDLAEAAGGEDHIRAYCASLTRSATSPATRRPTPSPPTPTRRPPTKPHTSKPGPTAHPTGKPTSLPTPQRSDRRHK